MDVLNNVSIAELSFNVVRGMKPQCNIECTQNPATDNTTFIVTHDRSGMELTVGIDVRHERATPFGVTMRWGKVPEAHTLWTGI